MAMQGGRHTVSIDITTISARSAKEMPIKMQRLHDEIVQMTLCKYQVSTALRWGLGTMACPVSYGCHHP